MAILRKLLTSFLLVGIVQAATVKIPGATLNGAEEDDVESFSAIPFAQPPVGSLRLRPPQRLNESLGDFDATQSADACPQVIVSTESENFLFRLLAKAANLPFIQKASGQSEDCLTITVQRPKDTPSDAKLPVMFYIYGGGYQLGWSSMYDGTSHVQHGIDTGKPFIYVTANYRVNGFGFLPGKEVKENGAGNLGLLDQRLALEWVADHIASFGGDSSKVTIWGESAGAWSIFNQMSLYGGKLKYKGQNLFRGAIMASGGVLPSQPIDSPKAQEVYDRVVHHAGCDDADDTLECLRQVDYTTFLNAVSTAPSMLSYTALGLAYIPRPDGDSLPDSGEVLAKQGKYAQVPFITGNQEDEGTIFALFQSNLTTTEGLVDYFKQYYYAGASESELTELIETYGTGQAAITENSPYGTGTKNEIFPGYKRRAAIIGDLFFTLTRRFFLTTAHASRNTSSSWAYMSSYKSGTPILGTFHGADILEVTKGDDDSYATRCIRTHFVNFLYYLDPNGKGTAHYPFWPKWADGNKLMQFFADRSETTADDFREDSFEWYKKHLKALRL
ncbi:hypothetical protein FDECE_2378 [Fusarium decemcellulare]|nr:hypothetical protein FDECE_2378 [Fusarium decemcellulare]